VLAERDVGLDRREVAAAVEDDRQLVAERQTVNAHRHGGRALAVEQRAPQQVCGVILSEGSFAGTCCSLTLITRLAAA
jgi:hypothetical protein